MSSRFWLDRILDTIEAKYPEGEILVSSGIAPSADFHIGHFREVLSADMITVGLRLRGRQAQHIMIIDDFDPLRKRYDFLPEEYEEHVQKPVCLVPDPEGTHKSYSEHYYQAFYHWIKHMELDLKPIHAYEEIYKPGLLTKQIETVVDKADKIREIFKRVSHRDLDEDYVALQILDDNDRFGEWHFKSMDKDSKTLVAVDKDGKEHQVPYNDGRVKLSWRLDWPARWQELGVMVEPHGFQEHGASGGSYQTGVAFAKEVFEFEPPIPGFQYGHVHLVGDPYKMSSSRNNLVTPEQAFQIMPPEMLKYFYSRYPGKKKIEFDPGIGLFRMMDEYSQVVRAIKDGQSHEFEPAFKLANEGKEPESMSSVPFNHLVSIYQAALGDEEEVLKILARTGYQDEVDNQADEVRKELTFVKNWLAEWAPEEVKFELQTKLPQVDLTDKEQALLANLADKIADAPEASEGQWYHEQIHAAKDEVGLGAGEAFKAVYKVLLAKESGPKAGWFLSILDDDMLVSRFKLES